MRVGDALKQAERQLEQAGIGDTRRKTRLLMMHVLKIDSAGLVARENGQLLLEEIKSFHHLISRAALEPLHRILGYREFHGLEFNLHGDTLEPRDDSEALVEAVLDEISSLSHTALRFADLGTGTGAIALALLSELPAATATLTDIADGAIVTARANARKHGLEKRCTFATGPWLAPLTGQFNFIVSNPPYISSSVVETLDPLVRDHDPRAALDGGEDGLDAYRIILRDAEPYLKPDGFLALEIGYDQTESVGELAKQNGWIFGKLAKDLGGNDRAMIFTL